MSIRREASDEPERSDAWPSMLDPAKGWRRCRKYDGFFCMGYLHLECRDEVVTQPPGE